MKTYICNKVAAVTVPSDLQSGGAEGAHLQCAVDYKSTYSMPADYKSTGTFSQRPIANSLFRKAASVLCTLCSVLFLASCTQDEIIAPVETIVPQGMKTVTVNFQMPEGKPAFGEGETRATTDGSWAEGDELLMRVTVNGFDDTKGWTEYESYLTLTYDGTAWDMVADKNTTLLEVSSTVTNPPYVMLAQTTDIDLTQPLTIKVPEDMSMGEDGAVQVFLAYAPEMEWDITPDASGAVTAVAYKAKADATTTAPECWEYSSGAWSVNQARLRIYTGQAGDVVTLTSEEFHPNSVAKSADYTYTATTQADGYAYFYGKAGTMDDNDNMVALTSGFTLSLTGVKVGEGDAAITCPLSPITLLEASTLVPVKLDAGKSYKLDASAKRTAAADGIAIVSGSETDLDAVKAQIETYLAEEKTTIVVTGTSLTGYNGESSMAKTVVGEAIHRLTEGSIGLVLPDATSIGDVAFYQCTALTSVSAPKATEIGDYAFQNCNNLVNVSAPLATTIGIHAFQNCPALTSVSLPKATEIKQYAFSSCSALTSLTFGKMITTVGTDAFLDANTENCALTLHIDQLSSTDLAPSGNTWAGKEWKSISYVDDEGNAIAVIDGASTDLEAVKAAISGKSTIYVTGTTLAAYDGESGTPKTVVGQAIYQLESGNIISIVLPDATPIVEDAFRGCKVLTNVSAPATTSIGDYAFHSCSALTSVSVPNATTIGPGVFARCQALTSVSLPKVETIETSTFTSCTALTSVSLPVATSIGNSAFSYCTALTSLTLGTVITTVGTNAFSNANTENCDLTLGTGSTGNPEAGENKTWADKTWASITVK